MFAQVVKSGYFQLRQTPGVPLSQAMAMVLGLRGLVVCLNVGACPFAQVSIGTSNTEGREVGETQGPGPFDGALGRARGVGHGCTIQGTT